MYMVANLNGDTSFLSSTTTSPLPTHHESMVHLSPSSSSAEVIPSPSSVTAAPKSPPLVTEVNPSEGLGDGANFVPLQDLPMDVDVLVVGHEEDLGGAIDQVVQARKVSIVVHL